MKALIILSHSWSPFLPLTCLYETKKNFYGSLCALPKYFLEKKLPPDCRSNLGWESFILIQYYEIWYKNYIEWHTSIQGMSLSDLRDYLRKREGSFKLTMLTGQGTSWFQKLDSYNNTLSLPLNYECLQDREPAEFQKLERYNTLSLPLNYQCLQDREPAEFQKLESYNNTFRKY